MSDTRPKTTPGHTTIFEYGNQSNYADSTTWTKVGQITDIDPPEVEADDIEVSNMESPDQFKEFDPGWADAGEIELEAQYEKANAAAVYGIFRTRKGFRMTFQDGSTWKFNGYLKKLGGEIDREGIVTQKLTFKVSGKPLFTAFTPPDPG